MITRFARALGAARLGQAERAKTELGALRALRDAVEQTSGAYWAGFVDIYARAVDGWTAKAEGHPDQGLKQMSEAAELEDAREKSIAMEKGFCRCANCSASTCWRSGGLPPRSRVRHIAREHSPNRFRSFLGGARAAEAAGDPAKARDYYYKLRS